MAKRREGDAEQLSLAFAAEPAGTAASDLLSNLGIAVTLVTSPAAAREIATAIASAGKRVGLDIETERRPEWAGHPKAGLRPHLSNIRLAQVYPGDRDVYVFDVRTVGLASLAPLWSTPLVAHNALFELAHFRHHGITLADIDCTMLMANPLRGGLVKLADLAEERLGWKLSKELQTSDWSAETLSREQLAYAALDAVAAERLHAELTGPLDDEDLRRTYDLMKRAQAAVAGMELAGIAFDRQAHRALLKVWTNAQHDADRTLRKLLGPTVSPASGKQLSDWLEGNLDAETLESWPRTKTGRLRTNAHTLAQRSGHPLVTPLLHHRDAATRLASFGEGFAAQVDPVTSRLHASFRLGAAASGRMACFDPNLQNVPREDAFRRLFVAPPGRTLVVADYSQIELRVAALVANDRVMLEAYARGLDLHRQTAAALSGKPLDEIDSGERQLAKAVNFGLLFGQGARGLASYARASYGVAMSQEEAEAARRAFFATYAELAAWQKRTGADAERKKEVRTPGGRRFDFRRTRYGFSYPEALNIPIQGGAAEVLMAALARLDSALTDLDALLVNVVHDEVVVECSQAAEPKVVGAVEQAMVDGFLDIFPNAPTKGLVEANSGKNWADAK